MAAGQLNRTRRALLGAAVALPLVARHCEDPGLEPGDAAIQRGVGVGTGLLRSARNDEPTSLPAAWTGALATFERAEAGLQAFERRTTGAPWDLQDAVEREMDARLGVLLAALRRLLAIPAPDLEAPVTKIALIADYQVGELTGGDACMAVFRRDALRLAGAP
jgi:hypothetical protein